MEVAGEDAAKGLFDASYSCQRCHMMGSSRSARHRRGPEPRRDRKGATVTTARQWARDESKRRDFMSDPSASMAGLGIQGEKCHGTGQTAASGQHGAIRA